MLTYLGNAFGDGHDPMFCIWEGCTKTCECNNQSVGPCDSKNSICGEKGNHKPCENTCDSRGVCKRKVCEFRGEISAI